MKIKHYIINYRNEDLLKNNLDSVYKVDIPHGCQYDVTVINNFGNLTLRDEYAWVQVINNQLRLDRSTGHLARNWNQGLLLGFVDLNDPMADIVILSQNDTKVLPNMLHTLIDSHGEYDFIAQGVGDSFHSYIPEAIKKVGLWDERFCGIGYQEYDFFYRCIKFNFEGSSINVSCSQRENKNNIMRFNSTVEPVIDYDIPTGYSRKDPNHIKSMIYHKVCSNHLRNKWGLEKTTDPEFIFELFDSKKDIQIPSYFFYPYFEKDVYNNTLLRQKYNVNIKGALKI